MENNIIFKEAETSILNYIKSDRTDYSIMLSGNWGCGKTYFVRNNLLNKITNEKKIIYTSASSFTNIENFLNTIYIKNILKEYEDSNSSTLSTSNIFMSASPIISKLLPDKVQPLLDAVTSITKDITKDKISFDNTLIVIDDLERLSDKIDIDTFLYTVFDNLISKNIKVLFVANEEEIQCDKYTKIKEKVIRHTIKLHSLDNTSFKYLAKEITYKIIKEDDYSKSYIDKDFFDSFIERTINIFVIQECFNLRIFIKFLDMSKDILVSIDNCINEDKAKLRNHKDIFINILDIFALTITEFESENKANLINYCILKNTQLELFRDNVRKNFGLPEETKTDNTQQAKDYFNNTLSDKLNKLEIWFREKILITFYNFLETGYFEHENIINEYKEILYSDEEYNNASHVLWYRTYYDSKTIKKSIDTIVSKMKNNLNNFDRKIIFEYYYAFLLYQYLFNKKEINKIYKVFESSIEVILRTCGTDKLNYIADNSNRHFYFENIYSYNKDDKLLKFEEKLIEKLIKENIKKETPVLLDIIKNFNEKNIEYCRNIEYKNLYLVFVKNTLSKINKTEFTISIFNYYIRNRAIDIINISNIYKMYLNKTDVKHPIIENIKEYINNIKTKDKHFKKVIKNLEDSINLYLERYK